MKDWRKVSVTEDTPILKVIEVIDKGSIKISLVINDRDQLLGTVTDGDIRRGLLKGLSLSEPVKKVMNTSPISAAATDSKKKLNALMSEHWITQIPILDESGKIVRIEVKSDSPTEYTTPVVIMAGGLGTRLGELTKETPKPLLNVGSKPILATIIDNFVEQKFSRFYLSVNYKSEMIQDYFGDGSNHGCQINYLLETKRMGTAGSLSLLPELGNEPLIVMNGDLLTKINFKHLLDFHEELNAAATVCVREYEFQVPFGVIETEGTSIKQIIEKPSHKFFVNAGIYVLSPKVLKLIPKDQYFDMPKLLEDVIKKGDKTAAFPIREYWLDIGRMDDFQKANHEFQENFAVQPESNPNSKK